MPQLYAKRFLKKKNCRQTHKHINRKTSVFIILYIYRYRYVEKHKVQTSMQIENNTTNLIDEIRLTWYRHVKRMIYDRLPKVIMEWAPSGKSKKWKEKKNILKYYERE